MTENKIVSRWIFLSRFPLGKTIFSFLLGRMIPYSSTIRFRVSELAPGHTVVVIKDRKRVRNHLRSVHAIALANLGELSSGLAVISMVPDAMRGIITHFEIAYHKKARGLISASASFKHDIDTKQSSEYEVQSTLRDEQGDSVAIFTAHWLIGPR